MEEKFVSFLDCLKNEIEKTDVKIIKADSNVQYNEFENLVNKVIKHNTEKFKKLFDVDVKAKFGHHFPDLEVLVNNSKYGIELKSRTNGTWSVSGGSVFESVSDKGYREIYVLFGSIEKNEEQYNVRFTPYWKAVESIKVTHKPRYFLNMNNSKSLFDSSSEYKKVREMTESMKNKYVQELLKKTTNKPQWYIADQQSVKPVLFNSLPTEKKNEIISELMILFPQDLLKHRSNYENSTEYLITAYFYYSPSLRDIFTAGGKSIINNVSLPKIVGRYIELNDVIKHVLFNQSEDFRKKAYNSWKYI